MAFLKGSKETIELRITAEVEGDLGKIIKVPFKATYKRIPVEEAQSVREKCKSGEMTDDDVIGQYLIGWRDFPGDDGEEFEFTEENLAAAMSHKDYRSALTGGYLKISMDRRAYDALVASKN